MRDRSPTDRSATIDAVRVLRVPYQVPAFGPLRRAVAVPATLSVIPHPYAVYQMTHTTTDLVETPRRECMTTT